MQFTHTHAQTHDFTCAAALHAFINKSRPPVQSGGGSWLLTLINRSLGVFFYIHLYLEDSLMNKKISNLVYVCSAAGLDYMKFLVLLGSRRFILVQEKSGVSLF